MTQITALQLTGLPGKTKTFLAKATVIVFPTYGLPIPIMNINTYILDNKVVDVYIPNKRNIDIYLLRNIDL